MRRASLDQTVSSFSPDSDGASVRSGVAARPTQLSVLDQGSTQVNGRTTGTMSAILASEQGGGVRNDVPLNPPAGSGTGGHGAESRIVGARPVPRSGETSGGSGSGPPSVSRPGGPSAGSNSGESSWASGTGPPRPLTVAAASNRGGPSAASRVAGAGAGSVSVESSGGSGSVGLRPLAPGGEVSTRGSITSAASVRRGSAADWEELLKHDWKTPSGSRKLIHVPAWLFFCIGGVDARTQDNILGEYTREYLKGCVRVGARGKKKESEEQHKAW